MKLRFAYSTGIYLIFSGLLSAPAIASSIQCNDQISIDTEKEMVINNVAALNASQSLPGGPWHFSSLMKNMLPAEADDLQVAALIEGLLTSFTVSQSLLVDPTLPEGPLNPRRDLPARLDFQSKILDPWISKSRELGLATGLNLDYAPFKLIAIVNRSDSRDPGHCRATAGEGRFVFAALNEPTNDPQNTPESALLPFTMIFEYSIPTGSKNALQWANDWHQLANFTCTPAECGSFRDQLKTITDGFSVRGVNAGRPSGNSLNQIRTNEILSFPGEMREFHLLSSAGTNRLAPVPVNRNPDPVFNHTPELATYVFANLQAVLNETFTLPVEQRTFTAQTLHHQKWTFPNTGGLPADSFEQLRFQFSKNTCDGCHSHEHPRITNLDGVYHINPEGELSRYMLQEAIPKRAALFCQLLAQTSCTDSTNQPVNLRRAGVH